ncbi:MAG TPA: TetR/AcrR family transcriptional regulator [Egibacteraceae bacterium]|nr:TetR/AcrR family transcriptional regulator [Egibacteraceae bacterium]
MTAARPRPGGRSARVRAAVLRATIAALVEDGVGGLRIEDIAQRAGVNKTSVYRRWGTREALLADALLSLSAAEVPVPDEGDVRADLVALARRIRDAISSPVGRSIVAAFSSGGRDSDLADVSRRFWRARFEATGAIVERAVQRGELPPGVDAQEIIESIAGPVWLRIFGPGEDVDDDRLARLVDIVVTGITEGAQEVRGREAGSEGATP